MSTILISAAMSACAVYIVACYFGMKKVCGYHAWVDVGLSLGLGFAYFGTFSGMVTAFAAGLMLSLMFIVTRAFQGYSRLTRKGWVDHPARIDFKRFNEEPHT